MHTAHYNVLDTLAQIDPNFGRQLPFIVSRLTDRRSVYDDGIVLAW